MNGMQSDLEISMVDEADTDADTDNCDVKGFVKGK